MEPDDETHISGIDLREPRVAHLARVLGVVGDVVYAFADKSSWAVFLRNGMLPMNDAGVRLSSNGMGRVARWRHPSPQEALEALVTAELLPSAWVDTELAPNWGPESPCACQIGRCPACRGDSAPGFEAGPEPDDECRCSSDCLKCASPRHLHVGQATCSPPSHVVLTSVASLGPSSIAAAEEIADKLARRASIVWTAPGRRRMMAHHESAARLLEDTHVLVHHFSFAEVVVGERWPDLPRVSPSHDVHGTETGYVADAWDALAALRRSGVHLLGIEDGRVILGVTSLRRPRRAPWWRNPAGA